MIDQTVLRFATNARSEMQLRGYLARMYTSNKASKCQVSSHIALYPDCRKYFPGEYSLIFSERNAVVGTVE